MDSDDILAIAITKPMAQLIVRNLDDELVARLRLRAAEHGRSAEAEHREILREALATEPRRSFRELAAKVRSMTEGRAHTPSETLLREGRDER
jgi:plasmid stability protein